MIKKLIKPVRFQHQLLLTGLIGLFCMSAGNLAQAAYPENPSR